MLTALMDPERSKKLAKENVFNVLVYGHTHVSKIKWEAKTLYINPGSPTDPASFLTKPSVAIAKNNKRRDNSRNN